MGTTIFKNRDLTIPRRCKHCGKRPSWWGMRFGVEMHRIWNATHSVPYQDRYMLCLGPIELRLHKFMRGDDDRAPHDHPWWFITFPFKSYTELVAVPAQNGYFEDDQDYWCYLTRTVKAWRFHFRSSALKHIVISAPNMPFWTFVIAGRKTKDWGFWRKPSAFTPHEMWFKQ